MGKYKASVDRKHRITNRWCRRWVVWGLLFALIQASPLSSWIGAGNGTAYAIIGTNSKADNNNDGIVGLQDFARLSERWERFSDRYDITGDNYVDMADLFVFADNWLSVFAGYSGGANKLDTVYNANNDPIRLCYSNAGQLFVSDSKACSVFIYEPNIFEPNMIPIDELQGLDKPLGIAVDNAGFFYVGNDSRNNVEIFNPSGNRVRTVGDGVIKMPNSIKIGPDDNIYICDSLSDCVRVYDLKGKPLRIIGSGLLLFPSAIEIATIETSPGVFETGLYVGDQAHYQVKVFDLEGNLLRSFGSYAYKSMMGGLKWQGKFISIQSLLMDHLGRLHVLDSAMKKVQILNPQTGVYIDYYGEEGTGPGQLKMPLDIAIDSEGNVVVANTGNGRVEVIYTVP